MVGLSGRGWRGWVMVSSLFLTLSPCNPAVAAEGEILRVAVAEFPPGFVSEPDGKVGGTGVALVEAVLREAGYAADLRIFPIGRVRALIDEGSIDVTIATPYFYPDTRCFTRTPFGTLWVSVFSRADAPGVTSLADLDGKDVIVPFGQVTPQAMLQQAAPNAHILEPRTHENALHMLRSGRANYLLDWRNPIVTLLAQKKEDFRQFDLPAQHTYFVVSYHRQDVDEVVRRLDSAMERLTREGILPTH